MVEAREATAVAESLWARGAAAESSFVVPMSLKNGAMGASIDDAGMLPPTLSLEALDVGQVDSPGAGSRIPATALSEIRRDLGRTFPAHFLFACSDQGTEGGADQVDNSDSTRVWLRVTPESTPGLAMLQSVLAAFAVARPDVSYCQGVNYVAAVLLMLSAPCPHTLGRYRRRRPRGARVPTAAASAPSSAANSATSATNLANVTSSSLEIAGPWSWISSFFGYSRTAPTSITPAPPRVRTGHRSAARPLAYDSTRVAQALALLLAFSDGFAFSDVWRSGVPRLRVLGAALSGATRQSLPVLHDALTRLGVDWDMLAAHWILPLGATALPPCTLARVWDAVLAQGSLKALLRVFVALLGVLSPRLLDADLAEFSTLQRTWRDGVASGACADSGAAANLIASYPELAILWKPAVLLQAASRIKGVTRRELAACEERHAVEVLTAKLAAGLGDESSALVNAATSLPRTGSQIGTYTESIQSSVGNRSNGPGFKTSGSGIFSSPAYAIDGGSRHSSRPASPTSVAFEDDIGSFPNMSSASSPAGPLDAHGAASLFSPPAPPPHRSSPATTLSNSRVALNTSQALSSSLPIASSIVAQARDLPLLIPSAVLAAPSVLYKALPVLHQRSGVKITGNEGFLSALPSLDSLMTALTGAAAAGARGAIGGVTEGLLRDAIHSAGAVLAGGPTSRGEVISLTDGVLLRVSPLAPDPSGQPSVSALISAHEIEYVEMEKRVKVPPASLPRPPRIGTPLSPAAPVSVNASRTASRRGSSSGSPTGISELFDSSVASATRDWSPPSASSVTATVKVLSYPVSCPTRIDQSPLAIAFLRGLVADLGAAGVDLRADIKALTNKINASRAATAEASAGAERARAALAAAESRTLALLDAKRVTSARLHELVTGSPPPIVPLSRDATSLAAASDSPAPLTSAVRPPGPGLALRQSDGVSSPGPPAAANASAVKRFSAQIASLDSAVHESSGVWKRRVWESTLASTRLQELTDARDALSKQLVAVTSETEARRAALLGRVWRALSAVWAAQVGRRRAAIECLADAAQLRAQ